ncbi:uncharacterized protein LOC118430131 [Branchiostoma floridae]|uniref:Uncharacterized protein LOC118430131 n=2 Tax=Branchiostoma floridae TaxID=7739 RepID=A0A9J7MB35_BRAFL|nr:uncharacterized protein LOC118430131 [Branchiostoma floridae]
MAKKGCTKGVKIMKSGSLRIEILVLSIFDVPMTCLELVMSFVKYYTVELVDCRSDSTTDLWRTTHPGSLYEQKYDDYTSLSFHERKDPVMESKQRIPKGALALALLVLLGFYKGAYSKVNCQEGNGVSYRGTVSVTETGKTCQRWDSQTPHKHDTTPAKYPSSGLEENYCRNPDGWHEIWCLTMDPNTWWERCDIPDCDYNWLQRSSDWAIDATVTQWPQAAGADKVLDGNYYSHWNPSGRGPWYIIFDLVGPYTLSKIGITNNGDTTHDISKFRLQTSVTSDPYNWEDVVTVTDVAASSELQEFGGFSATGRFWKFNATETYGTWQPWLREVNFFGARAGADMCGLSTFRHVPQTDCYSDDNLAIHYGVTLQFCAVACCAASSCLSFQFNSGSSCYLKRKLCSDEEKVSTAVGNMYDWSLVSTQAASDGPRNIALGMPAAQSSTIAGLGAELGVDGDRGNCFHTNSDSNPWWRVDLVLSRRIDRVVIFNRMDGWTWQRLDGFNVYVGDNERVQDNPLCAANQPVQTKESNYTISCYGLLGQYVGILIPRREYFHLCEVEVYEARDRTNLALGQPAEQSITVYGSFAHLAVDGNRDAVFYHGSCTHTLDGSSNWWHVDLGTSYFVDEVVVFNRLDCCFTRLDNFMVHVGDNPVVMLNSPCEAQQRVTTNQVGFPVDCRGLRGRYVGIHLPVQGSLTLCEVEVYGEMDPSSTKEFIIAFPENFEYKEDQTTMLFITGARSTPSSIEVDVPSTGFFTSVSVTSSEVAVVELPRAGVELKGSQTGKEAVSVRADSPIMVYGMSHDTFSVDAFLALPTDVLGTEYYVICSEPSSEKIQGKTTVYPTEFVVVGIRDGTTVNIVPTQEVEFNGQHYSASQTFTITVDRMDSLQVQSVEDLAGSKITSSEPVAVLSGNFAAIIGQGATTKDHLVEMIPPVETWGTEFALVPLVGREAGDIFRVLASQDNTQVNLTGHASVILHAGEFWEFDVPSDQYKYLTASKPALVAQYSKSMTTDNSLIDPFMMIVPSLSQFAARYTFVAAEIPSESPGTQHVNIIIKASHRDDLRMDGMPLSSDTAWAGIPGTNLSAARITVTSGAHMLNHASPLVTFGITVYGYRQQSPLWSYGYPGGLNLNVACIRTLQVAGDGIDNDCDQFVDEEIPNGIDDDGDGWIDEDVPVAVIGCDEPMGMESGLIQEESITASTELTHDMRASKARLNTQMDANGAGSWASGQTDGNQWLQVDLGRMRTIAGVITQGRNGVAQWVTSYKLQHGVYENHLTTIVDLSNGLDKIFPANDDSGTKVTNVLDEMITTRYVRFRPLTWHGWIAMRVEILGCRDETPDPRCPPEYKRFRSVCYQAVDTQLSFDEAERHCVDNGAVLAMPHDTETVQFLISLKNSVNPNSLFWIGLSDRLEPGVFKWNDGNRLQPSETNWHPGEPSITWSGENCVLYLSNTSSNLWVDQHCTTQLASYICEVPAHCPFITVSGLAGDSASRMGTYMLTNMVAADRPVYKHLTHDQYIYATYDSNRPRPASWYIGQDVGAFRGCPLDYTHTQGRCWQIHREAVTYSTALATCAAEGGVLMMPTNSELNGALETLVRDERESYWIGLTDPGDGGRWTWTDGSVLGDRDCNKWRYSW